MMKTRDNLKNKASEEKCTDCPSHADTGSRTPDKLLRNNLQWHEVQPCTMHDARLFPEYSRLRYCVLRKTLSDLATTVARCNA